MNLSPGGSHEPASIQRPFRDGTTFLHFYITQIVLLHDPPGIHFFYNKIDIVF